ncbi:tautomerase family protein [Pseudomonas sp. CGJS7]|uniref:tautomerase family protein n=1 Tax=Pseudomonas sp. CGJS7 TaxID=3109348 RepID=UPI0030081436
MPARPEPATMPHLNLQLSGTPDADLSRRATALIADLTVEVLGKPRELIAIAVHYVDRAHWFIDGRSMEEWGRNAYHLDISITDETNTKGEKARYLEQVHARLSELIGNVHDTSYIHIIDARAAAYGYGGSSQERRYQLAQLRAEP